jgi:hypothetical protein
MSGHYITAVDAKNLKGRIGDVSAELVKTNATRIERRTATRVADA